MNLDAHPQLYRDHGTTGDAQLGRPRCMLGELRSGDVLHDASADHLTFALPPLRPLTRSGTDTDSTPTK